MLESIIKLVIKSTGLFAGFVFALDKIDVEKLYQTIERLGSGANLQDGIAETAIARVLFAMFCLGVIFVGYYIFSDIAKILGSGIVTLKDQHNTNKEVHKKQHNTNNKQIELLEELNEQIKTIKQASRKTEQRPYPPDYSNQRNSDDPNRRMNEGMRPPTM